MMKMFLRLFVFVAAVFVFAAGAEAQTCSDVAPAAAGNAQALERELFAVDPAQPQERSCNVSNYSPCDSLHGTSCLVEGESKRCYLEPAYYCEWSRCWCRSGVWQCAY